MPQTFQEGLDSIALMALPIFNDGAIQGFEYTEERAKEVLDNFSRSIAEMLNRTMPKSEVVFVGGSIMRIIDHFTPEDKKFVIGHYQRMMAWAATIYAWQKYTSYNVDIATVLSDIADVVVGKQKDYGKGNILDGGFLGLVIRTNDKINRLKNLLFSGTLPSNESVSDTWLDIVGYSYVAQMFILGWFELPLEENTCTCGCIEGQEHKYMCFHHRSE